MKNFLIVNPKDLEKKKKIFSEQGKDKIHVLTDFDRTLTKAYVKGNYVPSIISILRDHHYISKDYSEKAKALFNKYHPIEMNLKIPTKIKKKKMNEWWTKHFKLLIESGLNKSHLERIVREGNIKFREGALEFVDVLHKYNIPLVIISSSGVGNTIPMLFEKEKRLYSNIYIITNIYSWDRKGNAIEVKKPIIHAMNKEEIAIKNYPVFKKIKDRKNILLLGDSIDDLNMIKGAKYDNVIKIGFLNSNVKENLKDYKKNFDVLILKDSNMSYINKLMREIIK